MSEDKGYGFITLNYYMLRPGEEKHLRSSFGMSLDGRGVVEVVDELRDKLLALRAAELEGLLEEDLRRVLDG